MLQLADRSYVQPEGKIEDILVRVDKFIFPADFLFLDCEADDNTLIILGRSLLATGCTLIDVEKGELTMRVNDQQVKLNAFHNLKRYDDAEECKVLHTTNAGTKISCFSSNCLGSMLGKIFGRKIKPDVEATNREAHCLGTFNSNWSGQHGAVKRNSIRDGHESKENGQHLKHHSGIQEIITLGDSFTCTPPVT